MCDIRNLAAQLTSLGVVVEDEAVVARVISSMMDDRFRQFREAWRSVETSKQKTELLLSRLKIWELEEKESSSLLTSDTQVNAKAFRAGPPRRKKTKEEIAQLKKKTNCRECGKQSHRAAECRSKKDKSEQDSEAASPTSGFKSFAVGTSRDAWYNDSGASMHQSSRKEWFTTFKEYDEPVLTEIADGSFAKILGQGTVLVKALVGNGWKTI